MITFKTALRNVLRQKRRTLLTVLTMQGGFVLASISIAWSDGTYNGIIDMFTRNQLGHVQIHKQGYLDRPTIYNTIDNSDEIGEKLDVMENVVAWTPRLFSAGLASVGEKTSAVRIMGIDPVREVETTRFDRKIVEGKSFSTTPSHEAIIGRGLAEILKAGLTDEIIIVSQGADGSIANDLYTIVGLIETSDALTDQSTLFLSLADAQELLVLEKRVHEMAIVANDLDYVEELTIAIDEALNDDRLVVETWQEFARAFYTAMKADQKGTWIMLFVIVLIVSVGVLNTVLMTVLERRREYGVLRAIGVRPVQVVRLVLYEVAIMALVSLVLGTVVGLLINYWLSIYGFAMPNALTYGGMEFREMYSEMNIRSYTIPAITVFVSGVLVAIIPAIKAAKTAPAEAMRTH